MKVVTIEFMTNFVHKHPIYFKNIYCSEANENLQYLVYTETQRILYLFIVLYHRFILIEPCYCHLETCLLYEMLKYMKILSKIALNEALFIV